MTKEHNTQRPRSIILNGQVVYGYLAVYCTLTKTIWLSVHYSTHPAEPKKSEPFLLQKVGHLHRTFPVLSRHRYAILCSSVIIVCKQKYYIFLFVANLSSSVPLGVYEARVCLRSDDTKSMETIPFLYMLAHKLINLHSCEIHSLYV